MTSSPDFERRMNRFENETVAIYELIEDFREETRTRFEQIETRLEQIETRLDRLETQTRTRFDGVEATLAEVLRRLPEAS